MRLIHIFWSLVVVAAMIVLPTLLFLNHGKLQGGPEIVGSFLISWWVIDVVTPLALVAAWVRKMLFKEKFFFTLLAALNFYFGSMGIYQLINGGIVQQYKISAGLFLLNLFWGVIIVYFQLRPQAVHQSDP